MKKLFKIASVLFGFFLLLIAIPPLILAYPDFLFDHKTKHGDFIILSNQPDEVEMTSSLDSVAAHLRETGFCNRPHSFKIVLCDDGIAMTWIETLSFTSGESGFHHFSGTIYLFPDRIARFQKENQKVNEEERRLLKYTYQEFELKNILIHEAMHQLHSDTLGWWTFKRKMPPQHWKAEGFAEYYTFLPQKRNDPTYDFRDRVKLYVMYKDRFPLMYLKSQLLYEFLTEYQDKSFHQIMADEITEAKTLELMIRWYDENPPDLKGRL